MKDIAVCFWSHVDPATSQVTDRASLPKPGSEWTVVVRDHRHSRRQLIERVIEECGLRACWIEDVSAIEQMQCSYYCSIAMVALGPCPPVNSLNLQAISRLKQKGFKIISYE